ncbi:hypothetical protein EJB05_28942, partial [Eragrostis curvula]
MKTWIPSQGRVRTMKIKYEAHLERAFWTREIKRSNCDRSSQHLEVKRGRRGPTPQRLQGRWQRGEVYMRTTLLGDSYTYEVRSKGGNGEVEEPRLMKLEASSRRYEGVSALAESVYDMAIARITYSDSREGFKEERTCGVTTMEEKRSTMMTTSIRTLRTRLALPRTTPVEMEDTLRLCAARCMYFSFGPTEASLVERPLARITCGSLPSEEYPEMPAGRARDFTQGAVVGSKEESIARCGGVKPVTSLGG